MANEKRKGWLQVGGAMVVLAMVVGIIAVGRRWQARSYKPSADGPLAAYTGTYPMADRARGAADNIRGMQLFREATQAVDAQRFELLDQAASSFRDALAQADPEQQPADWAITQLNLGNTLFFHGASLTGLRSRELLILSERAYREALTIMRRPELHLDWPEAQLRLGNVLQEQAERAPDEGMQRQLLSGAASQLLSLQQTLQREQSPDQWRSVRELLKHVLGKLQFMVPEEERADIKAQLENVESELKTI